jgi:hypothetical protein
VDGGRRWTTKVSEAVVAGGRRCSAGGWLSMGGREQEKKESFLGQKYFEINWDEVVRII